jgi:hypothetical protein
LHYAAYPTPVSLQSVQFLKKISVAGKLSVNGTGMERGESILSKAPTNLNFSMMGAA